MSVVLPEGNDERIIQAARRLKDEGIAEPIVLGKPEKIEEAVKKAGVNLDGIKTINPRQSDKLQSYAAKYAEGRDDISEAVARRVIMKPLFYGGMMVKTGQADSMVGGAMKPSVTSSATFSSQNSGLPFSTDEHDVQM